MSNILASAPENGSEAKAVQTNGLRKNGKQWHQPKKAFRPTAGQTSYAKRVAKEAQETQVKQKENEMKAEKEGLREVCGRREGLSAHCGATRSCFPTA